MAFTTRTLLNGRAAPRSSGDGRSTTCHNRQARTAALVRPTDGGAHVVLSQRGACTRENARGAEQRRDVRHIVRAQTRDNRAGAQSSFDDLVGSHSQSVVPCDDMAVRWRPTGRVEVGARGIGR